MTTTTEWCSNCQHEVELSTEMVKQVCPECGVDILPCSMCDMDANPCRNCPIEG